MEYITNWKQFADTFSNKDAKHLKKKSRLYLILYHDEKK